MYPYARFALEFLRHRKAAPLDLTEEHRTRLTCWPWDVDPWREMNNGRVLTLYDLGRAVLFSRLGVVRAMRRRGWAGAVAGASVRYRRRVRMFERVELRSRVLGWDTRFLYVEQGMWRGETCCSHALLRMAVTSRAGLVPAAEAARALGLGESPELPAWAAAWIAAEAERPWPPMAEEPVPAKAA
jgi:acyl-CoA thioesterase FadM